MHVEDLRTAFAECRRVLRAGAPLLVYQMFATADLEPVEADRLWAANRVVPASADRVLFERALGDAGFRIEHRDELSTEWREHDEEQGQRHTSRQMLRLARLQRRPDHYRAAIGDQAYEVEVGNCLLGIYQMIGKISPAVYVLR